MPLRLIHLTDLHIADKPDWDPTDFVGRARNPLDPGHDPDAAKKLSLLFRDEGWIDDPEVRILVSGDLTRTGGSPQFGCAHRLLHAEWEESTWVRHSLRVDGAGSTTWTVPGNHDFWAGYDLLARAGKATLGAILQMTLGVGGPAVAGLIPRMMRSIRGSHFRRTPWLEVLPLGGRSNRMLELIGLDSCSGLGNLAGVSPTWIRSNGFVSEEELEEATKLLDEEGDRAGKPYRVLAMHHPPASLHKDCLRPFFRWLEEVRIEAILTGHTHKAEWYWEELLNRGQVLVFDAGSTLVYRSRSDQEPEDLLDTKRYDTFIEHELSTNDRGEVRWECLMWAYRRSLQTWQPFQRMPAEHFRLVP